jgi:hypothetical protein
VTGPEVVSPIAVDAAERLYEIATLMQIHGLPAPGTINLGYLPDRIEIHLQTATGENDLARWAAVIDAHIEPGAIHQAARWQEYHADGCGLHVWYAHYLPGVPS